MLAGWINSEHINQGAEKTNRLGIMINGTQFSLYANGHLVETIEDANYTEGAIGLFMGAVKTPGFTVWFYEIAYWEIP